jgi:hypothetical protein
MRQLGVIAVPRTNPKLTSLCENGNATGPFSDFYM